MLNGNSTIHTKRAKGAKYYIVYKEEGIIVSQVAKEYGVNLKIYNWMRAKTMADTSILEISRLKRENKELLEIIGRLTHNLTKTKKN